MYDQRWPEGQADGDNDRPKVAVTGQMVESSDQPQVTVPIKAREWSGTRMDPAEWEELADHIALQLHDAISRLEEHAWALPIDRFGQTFWPQVRELNQRVRTAPAIKLDDKLALQRRMNELCQRARQHHKSLHQRANQEREELCDAIGLAREALDGKPSLADVHQVRADLAALRERLRSVESLLRRTDRQQIWHAWQQTNQLAWSRLNELWQSNERILIALLDEAQEWLASGETRAAKERIKAFHLAASSHECAHQRLRALRARASTLWEEANAHAREKHEAYLIHARKRLDSWKVTRERNSRLVADIAHEISKLEQQAGHASTDVAAAMARGQIAERRRALAEVEVMNRDLQQRISAAESALE